VKTPIDLQEVYEASIALVQQHNQFSYTTSGIYNGKKWFAMTQWILGAKNVSHMWELGIGIVKIPIDLHEV